MSGWASSNVTISRKPQHDAKLKTVHPFWKVRNKTLERGFICNLWRKKWKTTHRIWSIHINAWVSKHQCNDCQVLATCSLSHCIIQRYASFLYKECTMSFMSTLQKNKSCAKTIKITLSRWFTILPVATFNNARTDSTSLIFIAPVSCFALVPCAASRSHKT